MFNYIEPFYFFIALFIGMFFVYISTPTPDIIIKYPIPEEADKLIFKDYADTCYKYIAEEIQCPANKNEIKNIDIQYVDHDKKEDKKSMWWN